MGIKTISAAALHQRMADRPVTVLDVNSRGSWLHARVPSALHLDPLQFGDANLPADRQAALVFYCSNPMCRKAPTGLGLESGLTVGTGFSIARCPVAEPRLRTLEAAFTLAGVVPGVVPLTVTQQSHAKLQTCYTKSSNVARNYKEP